MCRITVCGLAAAAAALLAACGSSGGNAASPASSSQTGGNTSAGTTAVITAHQLSGIGTVLVDQAGKTIYTPEQEASGTILCTGSCLSFWFPVTVTSASIPRHANGLTGVLGTIHRPDGKTQLTYNGKPLYTFRLDQAPGQVHGNNYTDSFGGTSFTWQALTAAGAPAGSGSSGATPSASTSQGSGYGNGY
jgi:predicted lipoprotein with Yx(FWY)xxD motif